MLVRAKRGKTLHFLTTHRTVVNNKGKLQTYLSLMCFVAVIIFMLHRLAISVHERMNAMDAMYTDTELSIAWLHVFLLIYSNILSLWYYLLSSVRSRLIWAFVCAIFFVSSLFLNMIRLARSHFLILMRPVIIPIEWFAVPCHRCCSILLPPVPMCTTLWSKRTSSNTKIDTLRIHSVIITQYR